VRADHLSCYGYTRNTSPHIDNLAAHGIKFNNTISQAPWTRPSVLSLLSGYYPHRHGKWLINKKDKFSKQELIKSSKIISLLPELLKKAGYLTWGFSANTFISKHMMRRRGFDESKYIWKAPAMEVVNYGIEKIRQAEKTGNHFFLYLHFMDSHHPLLPPEKYYNFFPTSDGEKNKIIHEGWHFKRYVDQQGNEFDNYKEHRTSLYDGAIRYTDVEIGRLITELKSSCLTNNTIVIILADHGDELWDHAGFEATHYLSFRLKQGVGHGHTLFQELIRVPLIITNFHPHGKSYSAKWQPTEIQDMIQLVDLVPTILDLIGLSPKASFDGNSLLPLIKNRRTSTSFIYDVITDQNSIFSECTTGGNLKISLIEYPYKFIYAHKETNALFNLEKDHKERENLINKEPRLASDMLEKVLRFKEEKPPETEEIRFSKDDLEKLQALGYVDNGK
jgi:arylsulfatase A-like enzyme